MNISIANDFSHIPSGRYIEDGDFSAQQFRDNILIPALQEEKEIFLNLDGTIGFSSCFLEEVFGGLIRSGFTSHILKEKLHIQTELTIYLERVWRYIYDEEKRSLINPIK